MSWLVTGGAGYIGSHVTQAMCDAGIPVVVIDDLSTGFAEFVAPAATFVEGSLLDGALVEDTLRRNEVRGVIHVAGYKYAGESVNRPLHTYEQNVTATLTLLSAMQRALFDTAHRLFGVSFELVDLV